MPGMKTNIYLGLFLAAVLAGVGGCRESIGRYYYVSRGLAAVEQNPERRDFLCDVNSSSDKLCLNGEWDFCYDPNRVGEARGYSATERPQSGVWDRAEVPNTYSTGERRNYQGATWYRREFIPPKQATGKRAVLRCLGVVLRAKVWVNGVYIGEQANAYLPFEMDITNAVRPGAVNVIAVEVDNAIRERDIPDANWNGWWNYGGISRDIYLDFRPDTAVTHARMDTDLEDGAWRSSFVVRVRNYREKPVREVVTMELRRPDGAVFCLKRQGTLLNPGRNRIDFSHVFGEVHEWRPGDGNLYELRARVGQDVKTAIHELRVRTGFRDVRTRGSEILFNGKPLLMKGICVHEEDYPGGNTVDKRWIEGTLRRVRDLGCNFVRTGHYMFHPYFYERCDELGLLVWSEIPAWKTSVDNLSDNQVWRDRAKPWLREMVEGYRQYPSVQMWSLGNEFASNDPRARGYVQQGAAFVRELDPWRLVTYASDRHREGKMDVCFDLVDVIAINEYYGWYYGGNGDIGAVLDRIHNQYPNKPILVSEVGAGAVPDGNVGGARKDSRKPYTLENQREFLREHLGQIYAPERRGYVAGALIWVLRDFNDPHRVGGGHPADWSFVNLKGLLSREDEPKPAYRTVRDFFEGPKR